MHGEKVVELADQGRVALKLRCRVSRGRKGNEAAKGSSQVGDGGNYTVMRRRVWHVEAMREPFYCVGDASSSCRWYVDGKTAVIFSGRPEVKTRSTHSRLVMD